MTITTNDVAASSPTEGTPPVETQQTQNAEPATPKLVVPGKESATPEPEVEPQTDAQSEASPEPEAPSEFTVPETMDLDDATIAKLKEVSGDLQLKPEQVQKLLDSIAPSLVERQDTILKETRETWASEVANDPKLGGPQLEANMAIADKAVAAFGSEGLSSLLNDGDLPLGKNPEVFAFLVKVGKAISEDSAVTPGVNGKSAPKSFEGDAFANMDRAASIMYGTQQR